MGYPFAQGGQAGLQGIAIPFLVNDAHRFAANHLWSRQIGFAQTETNVAGLRPIRDLTNRTLFDPAQKFWLELFQENNSSTC